MPQRKNESAAIENLQRYLRQLSYWEAVTPPPIDGVFESDTRRALEDFQALYDLPVTGVANEETWEALYRAYRASLSANTSPRAVQIFPSAPQGFALTAESRGFAVSALQYMLIELSSLYTPLEGITVTGVLDPQTEVAVRLLQAANRLPVTGRVDMPTWNAIVDQYNLLFSTEPSR